MRTVTLPEAAVPVGRGGAWDDKAAELRRTQQHPDAARRYQPGGRCRRHADALSTTTRGSATRCAASPARNRRITAVYYLNEA